MWRGTEVVITGRSRKPFAPQGARGFESLPLRQEFSKKILAKGMPERKRTAPSPPESLILESKEMFNSQFLGVITGVFAGVVWEILSTAPFGSIPTMLPSLILHLFEREIHIHHWLVYAAIIVVTTALSIKTGRLWHPAVLMVLFFLISGIVYNWLKFSNWHVFIK